MHALVKGNRDYADKIIKLWIDYRPFSAVRLILASSGGDYCKAQAFVHILVLVGHISWGRGGTIRCEGKGEEKDIYILELDDIYDKQ